VTNRLQRETDGPHLVMTNAVGAALRLDGNTRDYVRMCAHVLTGYEQWAVHDVCSRVAGLQAVIYDGFIATRQATEGLEAGLRQRSGAMLGVTLDLTLKAEPFDCEFPEPERAPWDY
jgi:hypothetical protein